MAIKRIFVTGAAGFIGSHLTRRLVQEGYEVGIQKRERTNTTRISDLLSSITVYDFDIRDARAVTEVIADYHPDLIIHLVAYYALEQELDSGEMVATNVAGTLNLFEAARIVPVPYFLNVSTEAVYRESSAPQKETSTLMPRNLYALTKIHAEEICSYYADKYSLNILTLRLFAPFGPDDHERRLIPYLVRTLQNGESPRLTTGMQQWDFIYIDDIIDAFVRAIRRFPYHSGHEIVNIGSGLPVSIREIGEMIHTLVGADCSMEWGSVPHRRDEVWYNAAEISKAGDLLGWKPVISIREGLTRTVNWCNDHRLSK
jgi:nucleoside-diphosphate-sugar epimerase